MRHTTKIIETRKLGDGGQFALLVECCGDEKHRHWLTVAAAVVLDDDKLADAIEFHRGRVAEQHEAARQAEEKLNSKIGEEQEHA